jgi:hypothetical protein
MNKSRPSSGKKMKRTVRAILLGWGLSTWVPWEGLTLAQCAMCASAAESGDVGRGLNISILFMLGVVFSLIGGVVVLVLRASRQDAQRGAPADPSASRL